MEGEMSGTHMLHMGKELRIIVRPIRAGHQHNDLDDLVAYEGSHGGVVADKVLHKKVPKLRPLPEVDGQPHLGYKVLQTDRNA
jgi:hypothetical protein